MPHEDKSKDKILECLPEPLTAQAHALRLGQIALSNRDLNGLQKASLLDASWVSTIWPQGLSQAATLALPEAARLGWAEGIKELGRLGGNPLLADDHRGGWGAKGPAPLAEALARGHGEALEALASMGACPMQDPKNIVWAVAYRAHRAGAAEGVLAVKWARAHGFNPWGSEEVAQACASEFLLAGSVPGEDQAALESFEHALFEGYVDGPQASHALWCLMFTVSGGTDKGSRLCELYLSSAQGGGEVLARSTELLSWALKGGCPKAARAAARALPLDGRTWDDFGGKALEAAAGDPLNLGEGEKKPERVMEALKALWDECGGRLDSRPRDMERVCFLALKTGRSTLFKGLMELGCTAPEAVMTRWGREATPFESSGGDGRGASRLECLTAMMAKALNAESAGEERAAKLHERFISGMSGRFGRRETMDAPDLSESLAAAQRLLLLAQGAPSVSKRMGPGRL